MQKEMVIDVAPGGGCQMIHSDALAPFVEALQSPSVMRASHVEPTITGGELVWQADMEPVQGPVLGPFRSRQDALDAEHDWLIANYLGRGAGK